MPAMQVNGEIVSSFGEGIGKLKGLAPDTIATFTLMRTPQT